LTRRWAQRLEGIRTPMAADGHHPSQHAAAHADPQGQGKLRLDARGRLRGKGVDELRGALRFREMTLSARSCTCTALPATLVVAAVAAAAAAARNLSLALRFKMQAELPSWEAFLSSISFHVSRPARGGGRHYTRGPVQPPILSTARYFLTSG